MNDVRTNLEKGLATLAEYAETESAERKAHDEAKNRPITQTELDAFTRDKNQQMLMEMVCSLSDAALERFVRGLPGYKLKIVERAVDALKPARKHFPVLNDWVTQLTYMQQSVLMSAVRNADGVPKHHKSKAIIRWYRRCILKSAFDGRELTDPRESGGGSFTGPVDNIAKSLDDFIDSRDEMSLHYYAHAMHAFEILGYHYPEPEMREFWRDAYYRMVQALHVWPETPDQMGARLGDNETGWKARNDPSTTCSD